MRDDPKSFIITIIVGTVLTFLMVLALAVCSSIRV